MRQLKASLRETLQAVGFGERVRVTRRGRPLVDIVAVAAGGSDDRFRELSATVTRTVSATGMGTGTTVPAGTGTTVPEGTSPGSPTTAERAAVRSLLRSYATAFSSSDVGLLRTIFAADVVRRGIFAGRCETRSDEPADWRIVRVTAACA